LIRELEETKKYIEMSFEIFDKQYLNELKNIKYVNMLVLAPYMFKQHNGETKICVGNDFLSPTEL
jgi:hypothetical protein